VILKRLSSQAVAALPTRATHASPQIEDRQPVVCSRTIVNSAAIIATHLKQHPQRPFDRKRHVGVEYDTIERTASIGVSDLLGGSDRLDGCGQSER
jgi:hypothetical protein